MRPEIQIFEFTGQKTSEIKVGDWTGQSVVRPVEPGLWIVDNDQFCYGCDRRFTEQTAQMLAERLESFKIDCLLTGGSKAIALAYETAKHLGHEGIALARKNISPKPEEFLEIPSKSITGGKTELLMLDEGNIAKIKGKRIALFDDTTSTCGSMLALKKLAEMAGADISVIATVWVEGATTFKVFQKEIDESRFIYLSIFPLYATGITYKKLLSEKKVVESMYMS